MNEFEKPVSDGSLNRFQHVYPKIVQETEVNDLINEQEY